MRADDDGFINNPKKLQRMVGCGEDDLKLLMVKKFILVFRISFAIFFNNLIFLFLIQGWFVTITANIIMNFPISKIANG
jgi:hypothetical protein